MNRQFRFIPLSLRNQANDPAGGGGDGTPSAPVTIEAILAALGPVLDAKFNSFRTTIGNDTNAAITKRVKGVDELAAKVEELAGAQPPKKGAAGEPSDPENERIKLLTKTVEDLKSQVERANSERVAAEQKARHTAALSAIESGVSDLRPELRDAAVAYLMRGDALTFDEAGNPLLAVERKDPIGMVEKTPLPIADALAVWKKSDAAKAFLPPPPPPKAPANPGNRGPFTGLGPVNAKDLSGPEKLRAVAAQLGALDQLP